MALTDQIGLVVDPAAIGTTTIYVILSLVLIAAVGLAAWWVLWWNSFKWKVWIWEEIGETGQFLILEDRGKILKRRDQTTQFKLRKFRNANIPPPPQDAVSMGEKGIRYISLVKYGNTDFDYYPIGWAVRGLQVFPVPFDHTKKNWASNEMKRSVQRHSTFWDRWGGSIAMAGTMIVALVLIIIIYKMGENMAETFAKGAQDLASKMSQQACTQSVEQEVPPVEVPPGI